MLMDHMQIKSELIEQLIEISKEAGKAILEIYNTNFDYQLKEDLSPLTKADTLSHNIICERLKVLTPEIPILSEENSNIPFNIRSSWKKYWIVDPLDGTKEFIKKNGEFIGNLPLAYHLKDRWQIIRGRKLLISGDPTHLQFLSYDDALELISNFFNIEEIYILKGGKMSKKFPKAFARNIAFRCHN